MHPRKPQETIAAEVEPFEAAERSGKWKPFVLVALLAAGLVWMALASPFCKVKKVEILCEDPAIASELATLVKPLLHMSLALVDLKELQRSLENDWRFRHVSLVRKWPDTVIVDVFLRKPALEVESGGSRYLCDSAGICYKGTEATPGNLLILHLPFDSNLLGTTLPQEVMQPALELAQAVKEQPFGRNQVLKLTPEGEFVLEFTKTQGERIALYLGLPEQLALKLQAAHQALDKAEAEGLDVASFDCSDLEGCVLKLRKRK